MDVFDPYGYILKYNKSIKQIKNSILTARILKGMSLKQKMKK